jgi:hypothetical protein
MFLTLSVVSSRRRYLYWRGCTGDKISGQPDRVNARRHDAADHHDQRPSAATGHITPPGTELSQPQGGGKPARGLPSSDEAPGQSHALRQRGKFRSG